MTTYTKNEILSSTSVSRNFGSVLDKLKKNKLEKVAILRNNKMEAVIIPIEEYEKMKELAELAEHAWLYKLVKEREATADKGTVSFEEVLKEYSINPDEIK